MKDNYIDYEKFKKDLNTHLINNMQIINDNSASSAKLLEKYLIDNRIKFRKEVTFDDFKGHRFDFYLYDLNTLIEYDGEQHYKSIEYFGGKESFIERQAKDKEKDKYCHLNNINLLRVKYNMTVKDMTKYLSISLKLIGIYNNYICHNIDYSLKEITVENILNLNQLSNIAENIAEIEENKCDVIDNEDKIVLEQYIKLIANDRIMLNDCYREYLKYYRAYYFEKSKLTFVNFKNYLIDYLKDSHKLSNGPIKHKNEYTFILKLLDDNEIDSVYLNENNDIYNKQIQQFCEYLDENGMFNNKYLPTGAMYKSYQDWIKENNPSSKSLSARGFGDKFIKEAIKYNFELVPTLTKKIKLFKLKEFNPYLLFTENDLNEGKFQSEFYKAYNNNINSRYLVNTQFNIDENLIGEIKKLIIDSKSLINYIDNIFEIKYAMLELYEEQDALNVLKITSLLNISNINELLILNENELKEILFNE